MYIESSLSYDRMLFELNSSKRVQLSKRRSTLIINKQLDLKRLQCFNQGYNVKKSSQCLLFDRFTHLA